MTVHYSKRNKSGSRRQSYMYIFQSRSPEYQKINGSRGAVAIVQDVTDPIYNGSCRTPLTVHTSARPSIWPPLSESNG